MVQVVEHKSESENRMPTYTVLMFEGEKVVTDNPDNKHFRDYKVLGHFNARNLQEALQLVSLNQVTLIKTKELQ